VGTASFARYLRQKPATASRPAEKPVVPTEVGRREFQGKHHLAIEPSLSVALDP
jgi:hypothetical protein